MQEPDWAGPLGEAYRHAAAYLAGLPDRRVAARADLTELRAALGGPLPDRADDPAEVVAALAAAVDPGVVATGGGRYFGFVVGGATPAALAADWLTSVWDQNAGLYAMGPAAAVAEEVAGGWVAELLGLPATASVGFVTGAQQANVTGLAAGRHEILRRAGWDVEADGLSGAPRPRVLVGQERHVTIDRAVRLLGLGTGAIVPVTSRRPGPDGRRRRCATGSPRRPGPRSSAPRSATSTPVRSTRSGRSATSPIRPGRGCTSTAPSACGRRPARGCGRWSPAWSWRTRGRRTRTSG